MAEFLHTIPLVNRGIKIRCKELHFYEYKNLVKTVLNDSNEDLDFFITDLLNDLIVNYDAAKLDVLDKFILLTYLRCVNVSPSLTLECKCSKTGKGYTHDIELIDLLDRVDDIKLQGCRSTSYNDLTINFQLPRSFINPRLDDMYVSSIQSVVYKDVTLDVKSHEYDLDKTAILNKIPAQMLAKFESYITQQNREMSKFELVNTKSPFSENARQTVFQLSFFGNTMLDFIKWLYTDNFKDLYQFEFNLYNVGNLPHEILKTSTLMELQIFTNTGGDEEEVAPIPESPNPSIGGSGPLPNM